MSSRGKGGSKDRTTTAVVDLVNSINKHKKFKQLASYSVQCLCKVVTPPHVGWEQNLEAAFEAGALEAITEVLNRHKGDEGVLNACNSCLAAMATKPKMAGELVRSGAMLSMLESVIANPEAEGAKDTLDLLETVATNNPEALQDAGFAEPLSRLIKCTQNASAKAAAIRTMEKINKVPGGSQSLIDCGAMPAVLDVIHTVIPPRDTSKKRANAGASSSDAEDLLPEEEMVEAAFRLLDRLCRIPEHANYVRDDCNGMEQLSKALEMHTGHDRICKVGGRVLTKLAAGNVSDLVQRMNSTSSKEEKEFLASLLANLALDEQNAEQIVRGGGAIAFIKTFESANVKTIASSARALGRIADGGGEILDSLISDGAVNALVKVLQQRMEDPEVAGAVIPTLMKFAISAEYAAMIEQAGGIDVILAALVKHPDVAVIVENCLAFIENLGTVEYDMTKLVDANAITATVRALKPHAQSTPIQLNGIRSLIYMAYSEQNLESMIGEDCLEHCLNAIGSKADKELVKAGLYLATSFSLVPENKELIVASGGIRHLLGAVATFGRDNSVKEFAGDLMQMIVGHDAVDDVTKDVKESLQNLLSTRDKDSALNLIDLVAKAGAFSIVPEFASQFVKNGGVDAVVETLQKAAQTRGLPLVERLLTACSIALKDVADALSNDFELQERLAASDAVTAVISALKGHPKLTDHVKASVALLEKFAQFDTSAETIKDKGGIEACVAALRANANDKDVVTSAVNTLLQIASSDDGAVAVAKHGGTRQIIAVMNANRGTPGFEDAFSKCLALLQRVALTNEGAEVLIKQGCVDAVVDTVDALSSTTRVTQAVSSVLAKLLTRDDVDAALERVEQVAESVKRLLKMDDGPQQIKSAISRLGYYSKVSNYAEDIIADGGVQMLQSIVDAVLESDDEDKQREILPTAMQAIADLAGKGAYADPSVVLSSVCKALELGIGTQEAAEAIKNLAAQSPEAAAMILKDGRALDLIIQRLRENIRDPDIAKACFAAIEALASHPETAAQVAASPALRLVMDWLDDNIEDASAETTRQALSTLATLAQSPVHAKQMIDVGLGDMLKTILSRFCIDSKEPHTDVLTGVIQVIEAIAMADKDLLRRLHDDGTLKRVLKAISMNKEYIRDGNCMAHMLNVLDIGYGIEGLAADLEAQGASGLIMAAMSANATNSKVLSAGTNALHSMGAGSELGSKFADEVNELARRIEESSEVSEDMVQELGQAVQKLGNFLLVDGVVTSENASSLLSTMTNAVSLLAESGMVDDETLCSALASVARIAMAGSDDDKSDAVNVIMDALAVCGDNSRVRDAAIRCLGMLADNPQAVQAMVEMGLLDQLLQAAKRDPGNTELNKLVSDTIDKITSVAQKNASYFSSSKDGTAALTAILNANASDAGKFESIVNQISSSPGGDEALWAVLASKDASGRTDMMSETLRALAFKLEDADGNVGTIEGNAMRATGISQCLKAVLDVQNGLNADSDNRTRLNALRMAESALALVGATQFNAEGAAALAKEGGLEACIQLLGANLVDPETVAKLIRVVESATNFQQEETCKPVAEEKNMTQIVQALKLYRDGMETDDLQVPEDVDIVRGSSHILDNVAVALGAENCGIERGGMRALALAQEKFPEDQPLSDYFDEVSRILASKFSDEPLRLMESRMSQVGTALDAAALFREEYDEKTGKVYYINTATGDRLDEMPAELQRMRATFVSLADAAARQSEDNIMSVEGAQLAKVVSVLQNHSRNAEMVEAAAASLNTLALNGSNCSEIAKNGGIAAIIAAIRANPDNKALLRILLVLFERVSRNDAFKEQIAESGGVDIVVNIGIVRHTDDEEVVLKSLSIMANLAFNSQANIQRIMDANGVKAVEKAMQTYPEHTRILENATCTLSNLMYGSDENKLTVGQTCGDEITHIVRVHFADVNLFKMALRALGNLSYIDENIRFIADEHNATEVIVKGMDSNSDDEEALQLAMEVIGNFASLEEEESQPEQRSISKIIYDQAGTSTILRFMKEKSHNSAILKSALNALANVCNDVKIADAMATEQDLVNCVVDTLRQHDWDEELVAHCLPLLATLTYSDECVKMIVRLDGIQTLLAAMDAHGSNDDVLHSAQLALTNLAADPDCQKAMRDLDGISTVLALLEQHMNNKEYCSECFATLTRLASDDDLSSSIAENGMHSIMKVIDAYNDDPEFLTAAFRLLGHLAFVESNLTVIVQYNGIQKVIQAISVHPQSRQLMVRSIQTIDNIAMANKENAALVVDEGGKELIEAIMETYPDDEEIQRYGKSALLSISALENLSRAGDLNTGLKQKKKHMATTKEDPLAEHRHLLRAGQVLDVWTKGSPKKAHLLVSPDFKSIVWQDTKSHTKLGAMDLRSVVEIREGTGPGHKKKALSRKTANAACCFTVQAERMSLDCETPVSADVAKWVNALKSLFEVFKTNPSALGL